MRGILLSLVFTVLTAASAAAAPLSYIMTGVVTGTTGDMSAFGIATDTRFDLTMDFTESPDFPGRYLNYVATLTIGDQIVQASSAPYVDPYLLFYNSPYASASFGLVNFVNIYMPHDGLEGLFSMGANLSLPGHPGGGFSGALTSVNVPEPWTLTCLGAGAVLLRRRRR
jgi:hypothetical protein